MTRSGPIDVCVVEDDDAMGAALSNMLEAAGFRARSYTSAEALLSSAEEAPSCFVIDVNLPGISGLELAARLAETKRAAPIVLISGQDEEANRRRAIGAGAIAFLSKPFRGRTLIDAVVAATK